MSKKFQFDKTNYIYEFLNSNLTSSESLDALLLLVLAIMFSPTKLFFLQITSIFLKFQQIAIFPVDYTISLRIIFLQLT